MLRAATLSRLAWARLLAPRPLSRRTAAPCGLPPAPRSVQFAVLSRKFFAVYWRAVSYNRTRCIMVGLGVAVAAAIAVGERAAGRGGW
jgi:hypothetical protein